MFINKCEYGVELVKEKINKENICDIIMKINLEDLPINKLPEKIRLKVLEGVLMKAYDYYKCPICDFFVLRKKGEI